MRRFKEFLYLFFCLLFVALLVIESTAPMLEDQLRRQNICAPECYEPNPEPRPPVLRQA